jgi:site-specific DNA-adenine methylase
MGSCFLKSKNMWSYYGSKSKIAKLYPLPKYDLIIEPFAGAAWYSVLHRHKKVLVNEKYQVIHNIWNWLINEANSDLILNNVDFIKGQDISQITLDKPHKDLIGFCINRGSIAPKNIVQNWSCQVASKPEWASTTNFQLKRIAKLLPEIKHWETKFGDYKTLPNIEATWFIDPPYQFGGQHYSENEINYTELAEWCKTRKGQIIVCENTKADWLNFKPLIEITGQRAKTVESVFYNCT